jgi:hypothetical protein
VRARPQEAVEKALDQFGIHVPSHQSLAARGAIHPTSNRS